MTSPDLEKPASRIGRIARIGNLPFVGIIRLYRVTLSPLIGRQCRFHPTCSVYGLEAYRLHGPARGSLLTCARILRCNPFVKGGYDPVPIPDSPRPVAPRPGPSPDTPAPPVAGRSDP